MFKRTYLGLEICRNSLHGIAIARDRGGTALLGGQTLQLSEDVVCPVVQELNILQPEKFVEAVQQVLMPLAKGEERIAVALPDAAGHMFLLDIDTPFNNRSEGEEIVRWRLKELLPESLDDIAIDYQILEQRESGSKRLLVSVIARAVLTQYEGLILQAGFSPSLIDFHALNLYSAYRLRTEFDADFMLIGVDGNLLSMLAFENNLLDFYRVKLINPEPQRIFQELNRSMVGYRKSHTSFARSQIYLHCDWPQSEDLQEAVKAAFEREVEVLSSPLVHLSGADRLALSRAESCSMAAVLGITERLIPRVG